MCVVPIGAIVLVLLSYLYQRICLTPIGEVDTNAIGVIETYGL